MQVSPMEDDESIPLAKHLQSYVDDLSDSCLGNPFPSETDFCFSEDRLFQIETELARSLEQDGIDIDNNDVLEAILESDSFLVDPFQEELPLPLSLPSPMPGEETSLIDLLLMGAEAVEARNWEVASGVIARLNVMLPTKENGNAPFDRLAFYFVQALDLLCSDNVHGLTCVSGPRMEIAAGGHNTPTICAFQMVQELSPYVKFAHFTANQAILEATWSAHDVQVVDFDIMEGIQWPPLMADLAARDGGCSLRITAVITDPGDIHHAKSAASSTGRRLKEFAGTIGLDFEFDQLVMAKEEDFREVEADEGRTMVANCMAHQVHMPNSRSSSTVRTFLNGVTTLLSPKIVVLVQDELYNMNKAKAPANASFTEFFCEALHHYAAISESLASGFSGGYEMWLKLVEKEILGSRIVDCVRGFGYEYGPGLGGFGPIPISCKNVAQAKFLVGLFCRDYWVQHDEGRMMLSLCWRSRPLITASIWAPIPKLH